jgi:hypothetical protein
MDIVTLRAWLHLSKKPQAWFAREIGISPQSFCQTMKHGGPRAVSNLGDRLRPILEPLVPYSHVTHYLGSGLLNQDGTSNHSQAHSISAGKLKELETTLRSTLEAVESLLRSNPWGLAAPNPPPTQDGSADSLTEAKPATPKPPKYLPKLRFLDEPPSIPETQEAPPETQETSPSEPPPAEANPDTRYDSPIVVSDETVAKDPELDGNIRVRLATRSEPRPASAILKDLSMMRHGTDDAVRYIRENAPVIFQTHWYEWPFSFEPGSYYERELVDRIQNGTPLSREALAHYAGEWPVTLTVGDVTYFCYEDRDEALNQ